MSKPRKVISKTNKRKRQLIRSSSVSNVSPQPQESYPRYLHDRAVALADIQHLQTMEGADYLNTLIDPEIGSGPLRYQDRYAGRTDVVSIPYTVDLPSTVRWTPIGFSDLAGPADESVVMALPGSRGYVWMTKDVETTCPTIVGDTYTTVEFKPAGVTNGRASQTAGALPTINNPVALSDDTMIVPREGLLLAQGIALHVYEVSFTTVANWEVHLGAYTGEDLSLCALPQSWINSTAPLSGLDTQTLYYRDIAGVWIPRPSEAINSSRLRFSIPDGVEITALAFALTDPVDAAFGFAIRAPNGSWNTGVKIGARATAMQRYEAPDMRRLSGAKEGRTTALSMLVTYAGAQDSDGGSSAYGRLGPGTSMVEAPLGDYYQYLSDRPVGTANYPTKRGGYVWWLPAGANDTKMQLYDNHAALLPRQTILMACVRRDSPVTIRLSIRNNYEFHTDSNARTTRPCKYNPEFSQVLSFGATLPAVSHNPDHRNFIQRLWDKVKSVVTKPENWLKAVKALMAL